MIRREKMVGEASVRWLYGGEDKGSVCNKMFSSGSGGMLSHKIFKFDTF